jgi:hypothetical protein
MMNRCCRRITCSGLEYFGYQNDGEACRKIAPYEAKRNIWLCDTHFSEWLEHEFSQSEHNPANEGIDYR